MFLNPKHIITSFLALCFAMGPVHEIALSPVSEKYGYETEHNEHTDGTESDIDDLGSIKIFEVLELWTRHFISKNRFVLDFYKNRPLQLIGLSIPTPPPQFLI
nr:hypothetical protein [uncultured Allomuricauda sp.]